MCFLTQSVQLTLSSVQLTLLECVMRVSKMQSMEISDGDDKLFAQSLLMLNFEYQ